MKKNVKMTVHCDGSTAAYTYNVRSCLTSITTDTLFSESLYYNESHDGNTPDHLGNNRVVANANGTVEQVNHYYPYGGLTGESTGGSVQPYKYNFSIERGKSKLAFSSEREKNRPKVNGKELERMNGLDLYDYGARWMDAALGRFTTIDPMCEKYYGISPYMYCSANPINRIDPDGRDEWEINNLGQIVNRIETKMHDAFFIVDDENKRIEGKSISFKYGTVFNSFKSHTKVKEKVIENGEETIKDVNKYFDVYEMRGDGNSTKLFEFLAGNTSVEWGLMRFGIEGNNGYNVLTTSHEERAEYGAADMLNKQYLGGYTIREHTHSHPLNTPWPSKYNPETKTGDLGLVLNLHQFRPKVLFKLYLPGHKSYIEYDENFQINH